jgi:hypothetical protein
MSATDAPTHPRIRPRTRPPGHHPHSGWNDAPEAVSALVERRLHGKAVLDLA